MRVEQNVNRQNKICFSIFVDLSNIGYTFGIQ